MLPAVRTVTLTALVGLCAPFVVPASAQHLVDLGWDPVSTTVGVGDVVQVRLLVASDGATGQPFSGLDTILDWDPALLELMGADNTGAGYSWFVSGFLPDPDGINLDLLDGDALFTALAQASKPAVAPAGSALVVTTFRFKALAPTPGTAIGFTPALGQFGLTRVLDYYQPGLVITGDISATLAVTVSGGPGTFCTSKPSSLPGCTPTLLGAGATVSKSGLPLYGLTASPVPGGNQPGLLIDTRAGLLSSPLSTSFGFLCLDNFLRASAFARLPGGSKGACDGSYSWDLAAISAYYANIHVGDTLHLQAWYRDIGYTPPGNANFTNGFGPVQVVP